MPDKWDENVFDTTGGQVYSPKTGYYSSLLFGKHLRSLRIDNWNQSGTQQLIQVPLDINISERLDKLLGSLESQDSICGNGTMVRLLNPSSFSETLFCTHVSQSQILAKYN